MSNNNLNNNFISTDGGNNFVGIDANGDGVIEQLVYDSNHDGFPEVRISSNTGFVTDASSFEPSFGTTPAARHPGGPTILTTHDFERDGVYTNHDPSFGSTPAARHPGGPTIPTTHDFERDSVYSNHGPSFGSTPQVPAPNFGDDIDIVEHGTEPEDLIEAYVVDLKDGSVAIIDVNDGLGGDSLMDSGMLTLQHDYKIDELAEDINDIAADIGIALPNDYNAFALDIDGNGTVDAFAIDLGNDATIDGIGLDLNEDGLLDVVGVDTDFDGIPDIFLSDSDNNGTVDNVFTIDEF